MNQHPPLEAASVTTHPIVRLAVLLTPALTALAFGWWMLARRQYILIDDAYISFRYAVNFAQGNGLVWNVGVPVEGYTCLLWVVLLSAIARTGIDLTWPAVILSSLFGLGCLELVRRIARAARPEAGRLWDALPGMFLACLPSFAHAMTSGMEESCFAFLCVLGIHLIIASRERPSLRWSAALSFAAACLTRPEGVLVTGVAMTTEVLLDRRRLRSLVTPTLCVAMVVLIHMGVRLAYYGYPFPNTFYAKVIFGRTTVERGAAHFAGFVLAGGWLLFLGISRMRVASPLRPYIIHGYALASSYCAYLLTVGGDHPHWNRFYIPLLPLPLLAASDRLRELSQSLSRAARRPSVLASAFGLGAFTLASLPFSEADEPIVGFIDGPIKKLIDEVDQFFAEVPRDSFLAVAAIGYVGYRNMDLHILDTWGLTDAHIAHLKVKPTVKFGHDKQDIGYVAAMKPDYVYVIAAWPAQPIPGYDLCWPSDNPPAAVHRRALPLDSTENQLGLPSSRTRRLTPPPPCRPPAYLSLLPSPQTQTPGGAKER